MEASTQGLGLLLVELLFFNHILISLLQLIDLSAEKGQSLFTELFELLHSYFVEFSKVIHFCLQLLYPIFVLLVPLATSFRLNVQLLL